jgi:DNA-directed RNA polymerase I, II, and III subunit RPABC2
MSDLENSDDEIDETKKEEIDEIYELENSTKNKISKKKISEFKIDSDDEENDDGDLINESGDDFDEDEEEEDDDEEIDYLTEINEDEITSKSFIENKIDSISPINSDVDSDDEENLQKFDNDLNNDYIKKNHSELLFLNNTEIEILSQVTRDENGIIIDDNHKTIPILTKYERTKILGQRTKQINNGDKLFIDVKDNIIDSYLIAELELKAKKIPFIIKRPILGGNSEYWKIKDLEQIY